MALHTVAAMSGDPELPQRLPSPGPVESPFAHAAGVAPQVRKSRNFTVPALLAGLLVVILAVGGGVFLGRHGAGSSRTVKEFPTEEYFSDYHSVAGGTFKTEATVAVDLGWKPESGRLMVFSTGESGRRFAVLFPPSLTEIHFSKGQRYRIVFKVLEGGLLYADSCTKL
jgi:hypothetical protein